MTEDDHRALHLAEVAIDGGQLVTSGVIGYVGVVNGIGESIGCALDHAYALARIVVVPCRIGSTLENASSTTILQLSSRLDMSGNLPNHTSATVLCRANNPSA